MLEKCRKVIIQEKFWRCLLILWVIMCVIPLLILAAYDHSSADDYSYGCLARWAWVDTHNQLRVFAAVGEKVKDTYQTWQGSYSAVALFALQPAVFNEAYYGSTTVIVLGMLLLGTFFFCRKGAALVGGKKSTGTIIALVLSLLEIELLPSPVEGLYWWNGSVYYVIFYALFLIQTVQWMEMVRYDKCCMGKLICLGICGIFLAGGNYVTALLLMETDFLILVAALCRKRKVAWKAIGIYLLIVMGFLINCLAPGNAVRQSSFEAWSPVRAVLYSYHEAYTYMVEWTQPLVWLGLLFLIPFLWKFPVLFLSGSKSFWSSLIALGVQYSLFASTFAPTLYAYGEVGAGRIQNIRFFFWLLSCILMEYILIGMVRRILEEASLNVLGESGPQKLVQMLKTLYERYAAAFFGCFLVMCAFFAGNTLLADDTQDLVSITAMKSLVSGEARTYDIEMKQRLEAYLSDDREVQVSPLSVKPELLFWEDITDDPEEWTNSVVARFYRKDKVYLGE